MILYSNPPNLIIFVSSVKCLFVFTIIITIILLIASKILFCEKKSLTNKEIRSLSCHSQLVLKCCLWIFLPNLFLQMELKLCTSTFSILMYFVKWVTTINSNYFVCRWPISIQDKVNLLDLMNNLGKLNIHTYALLTSAQ